MALIIRLASFYKIKKDDLLDIAFYSILSGIIGARIYFIFLELPYFLNKPLDAFKIWQGGLAIHGVIIGGILALYWMSKRKKINFPLLTALTVPGLALAQAIGRWGNYFNQEIFGKPTNLAWGIPINPTNRPLEYLSFEYFHPTFLYESVGNLLIFALLLGAHYYLIKNKQFKNHFYILIVSAYFCAYSLLRFLLEFLRLDKTPELLGLRWPQIVSLLIILIATVISIKLLPKLKKGGNLN